MNLMQESYRIIWHKRLQSYSPLGGSGVFRTISCSNVVSCIAIESCNQIGVRLALAQKTTVGSVVAMLTARER